MSNHVDAHLNGGLPEEPEKATLEGRNKIIGFWLYLGGETVIFGSLFATFIALRDSVLEGPTAQELFQLPMVALATFILLTSSMTSVMATHAMHNHDASGIKKWLTITVLLGAAFLGLEIFEFTEYVGEGHGFTTSAFSSAFYALVGFHGAHVLFGVIWISMLIAQVSKKGLTVVNAPKLYIAGLYWHFVDLVWIFIFTIVYLMGKVG